MDKLTAALFIRNLGNRILKSLNFALFPRTQKIIYALRSHAGKILIFRTGNIGDIACALPALATIRENFPRSQLFMLTSPGPRGLPEAREVVGGLGLVDEIITYYQDVISNWSFRHRLVKDLRCRDFHLFILLPQQRAGLARLLRDLCFARLLGVKGALGFALSNSFPGFDLRTLKGYMPSHNEVERLLHLLAEWRINSSGTYTFNLPSSCHRRAEELLKPYQKHSPYIIGFQVFAKAQANQWPLENFVELGKRLHDTFQPLFILFGGPGDREKLEYLAQQFPGVKLVVAGETTVLETTALLARCHVLITLDTGPMHIAALIGTSIVALFSARQFEKMWEPFTSKAVIIRKKVPCELCFLEKCGNLACMKAITVNEVFEETVKKIKTT